MSILCRIGLHKWKIVKRYVPGGFMAFVWPGVTVKLYYEYKGDRCKRCDAWRKEWWLYWWQWAGLAMFIIPTAGCFVWFAGWTLFGLFVGIMLLAVIALAGLFLFIGGCV